MKVSKAKLPIQPPAPTNGTPAGTSHALAWLLASMAAYVFWPGNIPRFFFLCTGFWLACQTFLGRSMTVLCAGVAATLYATAFLLTPVCAARMFQTTPGAAIPSPMVQLALLIFGCLWLKLALAPAPPVLLRMGELRGRTVLLWAVLLMAVSALPWAADVAYGGDEHYHLKALVGAHIQTSHAVTHPWFVLLMLSWLGAGVWLIFRSEKINLVLGWGLAGLALAACGPWLLPANVLQDGFNQDRLLRYPASQTWLGAWLMEMTRDNWGTGVLFSFEVLRFTPVFAVFLLGLVFLQERRLRNAPPILSVLGGLAIATLPTLLYHGTLLYLELALLPLLFLLVRDGRRWLLAGPEWLRHTNAWWAALALGFLKDTGIIAVGLLWLARVAVRTTFLIRRRETSFATLLAEARVGFVTLGPGAVYLVLRAMHGSRPYQPHFENILSLHCWSQAVGRVIEQFGLLWLPALVGVWLLVRRRAWPQGLAIGTLFGGMWLFHLLEEPRWIGLARFNLLLLPAVLVLASEGLAPLLKRRALALGVLLALLAGNAALSPVDRTGHRLVWGGSGERWYDFTDCLADLRKLKPDARLAVANNAHSYGIGLALQRLDWWIDSKNLPVAYPDDTSATLHAALELANKLPFDFVIFRWDGVPPIAPDYQHSGYVRLRDYASPGGTLTVFARMGMNLPNPQSNP